MGEVYFIGVDIGTTSTKAIVCSTAGIVGGIGNQEYPLLVPQPGWAEQEPEPIVEAVVVAVGEALSQARIPGSSIAAIGFSGAMHSLIALDHRGAALTNSMTWADNRSYAQTERLKQDQEGLALYGRTGTPLHPMLPLTKLLWLREQAPEVVGKAARFVSIKEYVLYRLCGQFVVDYSTASATGLFNFATLNWDQQALAAAGIQAEQLSELVRPTHIVRGLDPRLAAMMGIDPETPLVVGSSDGVLANLGVGAIEPGQLAVTIGTSSAVRMVVPQPLVDPQRRTFCYAMDDHRWVVGGASNNGGIVLSWLRAQLGIADDDDAIQTMLEAAADVAPGAEGLILLPFLTGERAPYWNPHASGVLFGLGLHHTRAHIVRAALEGILFAAYSINLALRDLTGSANEIRASGGFARSPLWRQMLADVFGYELLIPEVTEGSGFGAALLAMYALGAIPDLAEAGTLIHIGERHRPAQDVRPIYDATFAMYERVYHNLVDEFAALAHIQGRPGAGA